MKSRFLCRNLLLFLLLAAVAGLLPGQEGAKKPDPLLSEDNLMAVMHSISSLTLFDYVKELS